MIIQNSLNIFFKFFNNIQQYTFKIKKKKKKKKKKNKKKKK